MNETMECILNRRSTRKFLNKPIPQAELDLILQAALHAPSGMGLQTWQFTLVKNREKIQRLAEAVSKELGRPGYNMYEPEVILIPSNERDSRFGREDDACAMENIFLAAHSLGIGTVWINQLQNVCDSPAIRQVLDSLNIPSGHVVYGLAALGYPDDIKTEKARTGKIVVVE